MLDSPAQAEDLRLRVFDRIVCGIDGSPASLEAARQAERLRDPLGTLHLSTVTEVDTAVHAGWATSYVLAEIRQGSRRALHQAIDAIGPTSSELLAGQAVHCLSMQIDKTGATLVAVGPHGRSRALGILLGGVTATMLHEAPCSVLVARPPRYGPFPGSILVGLDGSRESLAAAAVARSIATRFDAELVAIAALGGKNVDAEAIRASVPLAEFDDRRPVAALADHSIEADLLVVGSRGLHGPAALGSVSERVAHQAACSVLVVR